MQGLFLERDGGMHLAIRGLVVLIGFWTAWRAGKATADGWRNYPLVIAYTFLLAWGMQFLHHALFDGPMLSLVYYSIDFVLLLVFSTVGFRYRRANQMVTNYYWLYEKTSPFSWRPVLRNTSQQDDLRQRG
ncbi:DUF6867 family protein [Rhizobium leguminosarum]|uniref:DUF6867 family protein n=1 Tax=Rhizobium leguminosarum TaxID=384 RepID=UPI001C95D4C6|nr:hypothetical protein [Rhizobium leguminosarum]MBY5406844.1 hypothetical protein [Rhizobium leguminosarum]